MELNEYFLGIRILSYKKLLNHKEKINVDYTLCFINFERKILLNQILYNLYIIRYYIFIIYYICILNSIYK